MSLSLSQPQLAHLQKGDSDIIPASSSGTCEDQMRSATWKCFQKAESPLLMLSPVVVASAAQLWVHLAQDPDQRSARMHLEEMHSSVQMWIWISGYQKGVGVGSVGTIPLIFQNILSFQNIIIVQLYIHDTLMNLMTMRFSLCAFNYDSSSNKDKNEDLV